MGIENIEGEVKAGAAQAELRRHLVDGMCQRGGVRLELGKFNWEVESERGDGICVAHIPWSWAQHQKDIVFFPADRVVMLVTHRGAELVIAGVLTLRKVLNADRDTGVNWTADWGYRT